ncbi:ComEA family DNA-binding protein [Candidatus Poribacteria bacterium]
MIYFTRQEQRIVILLVIVLLLGTGLLLIKRYQPGWVMRLSMGEPDFDVAKDERSPRLTDDGPTPKLRSDQSDADDASMSIDPQGQKAQSSQSDESDVARPSELPAQDQQPAQSVQDTGSDTIPEEIDPKAKININTASKEELEILPRIGPVLAQRIIDYRENYGKFTNILELTGVSGIGDATLQRLKDKITVEEHNGSE